MWAFPSKIWKIFCHWQQTNHCLTSLHIGYFLTCTKCKIHKLIHESTNAFVGAVRIRNHMLSIQYTMCSFDYLASHIDRMLWCLCCRCAVSSYSIFIWFREEQIKLTWKVHSAFYAHPDIALQNGISLFSCDWCIIFRTPVHFTIQVVPFYLMCP